ncbi:tyrosine-type recombinase/integrase [Acutalibacter intestini]|uniref:tyrosine-type recombinase/integrase n=1 Tax=Acutalibacter intestini TaxID=3093659 RepID=UPI002AC94E69|nr:tyrosine-type recombinase/integrase [Acutalibacter sp. M00204]
MLKLFSLYLHAMGKSHGTVSVYCQNISQYFRWCEETFDERPSQLYRANVLEYISYMRNIKGYNPKTVNHHLSSLRSYNDWLIESGQQTETVVLKNDFMKIQLQYASPSTVTKKDVEALRQRLLESGSKRDYAIVTLFAYSGIRRSECANLKLDQVDLTAREIRVIGKGDKQRLVYINDKIVYAMREYLKERNSDSPYFFVSRQSEKLTPSRINQIFNKYSNDIFLKTLRLFFCSHALESGFSIHEVSNLAGHSSIQVTMLYTNPTAQAMKDKANRL